MAGPAAERGRPIHFLDDHGRRAANRSLLGRLLRIVIVLACVGAVGGAVALGAFLTIMARTPREWAPYLERRADKHRTVIVQATGLVTSWLTWADRATEMTAPELPARLGASPERSSALPANHVRTVTSLAALAEAAGQAEPGDVIVLAPGRYRSGDAAIKLARPGSADAPITLRALHLGDAVIESVLVETFKISAPFWHIENLVMRGICGDHGVCEHAIHVVGNATDIVIRNNQFEDFNAQLKINAEDGHFPDHGVIEGNTLLDTTPRATGNPVTPIDLVAASHWQISDNIIADFVRADGAGATYGAFVKGAGEGNVIERNLVICEWRLRGAPGQHVGLSLGGGGTGPELRRDRGRTGIEQLGGVIRDNLIMGCTDDGIYLNRAARSVIDHNTLLDTAGIDARFVETSATVTNNLVDGAVRTREGAAMIEGGDQRPYLLGLFVGWHPQRSYFHDLARLDLTWSRQPDAAIPDAGPRVDLCGHQRGDLSVVGAFDNFAPCQGRP